MKQILRGFFLVLGLGCVSSIYGGMTNSGVFSVKNSMAWMDITNEITGVIEAERSKFLKLTNYGTASLDDCIMMDEVATLGVLTANGTQFLKDLTVSGGDTTLTSCQLENLFISEAPFENESHPPQVILNGNTIINGSIEFKVASATVYKGPNVVILGETRNGMLVDLQE